MLSSAYLQPLCVLYIIFQIFVKDNQGGEDTTVINHIGLFGTPRDINLVGLTYKCIDVQLYTQKFS